MNQTIQDLHDIGQSLWCDNLGRSMIDSGSLQRLIDLGVVGVTSNPTIFMKAIKGNGDYDELFSRLSASAGDENDYLNGTMRIYEGLVIPDIVDAADMLRPVYERTSGLDGYVSLEVNPKLAYRADETIAEARRLHRVIDRPNVFIKVPATEKGIPAIRALIGQGISVNVTLIFSISIYEKVARAYLDGLRRFDESGGLVSRVASVASFFVSRVDTMVDRLLQERRAAGASVDHLLGKAAIANARLAYERFEQIFDPAGAFAALAARGARVQRPLWASTSSKNPDYPDTMYVDELVGPDTVNTLPPKTIDAVIDHGKTARTIGVDLEKDRRVLGEIRELGVDMGRVTEQLLIDGVEQFARSFDELLDDLNRKRRELRAVGRRPWSASDKPSLRSEPRP